VNVDPTAGVAVSVTVVPPAKIALHVAPQSNPPTLEVTVPEPVPTLLTVTGKLCAASVAVTLRACVMVTVQSPVPVHAPPQLTNVEPASGMACTVTCAPLVKLPLHVAPQSIPPGIEAMMPLPEPLFDTVRVWVVGALLVKVAVTLRAALIVTMQLPVPVHAPLQPVKM
jgi:hypothetical protein